MKRFVFCLALCLACASMASPVSVMSDSTDAQACASSAKRAAKKLTVNLHHIVQCSQALQDLSLTLRDKAATLVNRAVVFMQLDDYISAKRDLLKAQDLHPSLPAIYVNLGNIFYRDKSYPEAIENYTLAIEEGVSELHTIYLSRGMTYKAMENPKAAENDFRKARELSPN